MEHKRTVTLPYLCNHPFPVYNFGTDSKPTYHSKTYAYLRTRRTQTYLGKETTHEIGDPWGLVDWTNKTNNRARDSVPIT